MEGPQFWKGVRGLDPRPPFLPSPLSFASPSSSYFTSAGKARVFEIEPKSVFNLVSVVSGNLDLSASSALRSPQSDNFSWVAESPVKPEKGGEWLLEGPNGKKVVHRQHREPEAEASHHQSVKAVVKGGNSSRPVSSVDHKPELGLAVVQDGIQLRAETASLLRHLSSLSIPSTTSVYMLKEERQAAKTDSPLPLVTGNVASTEEVFCKNLFLKDRRGQFYLVVCREETDIDLKRLKKELKACRNFSFGTAAELSKELGVPPGCVTPFAFFSPSPPAPESCSAGHPSCSSSSGSLTSCSMAPTPSSTPSVRLAVARSLLSDPSTPLNFHPLDVSLTTAIRSGHLEPFLHSCGVAMETVDL